MRIHCGSGRGYLSSDSGLLRRKNPFSVRRTSLHYSVASAFVDKGLPPEAWALSMVNIMGRLVYETRLGPEALAPKVFVLKQFKKKSNDCGRMLAW